MQQADFIWMNGELVRWEDAKVHVLTHALHYGSGVFEGIRAYETERGTAVFRHQDHLDRLQPLGRALLHGAALHAREAARGDARADPGEQAAQLLHPPGRLPRLRRDGPLPAQRAGRRRSSPSGPGAPTSARRARSTASAARSSSWRRMSDDSFIPQAKACGQYLNSILAKVETAKAGYDEAILLDEHGNVSEGSGENVFVVRDGHISTPLVGVLDPGRDHGPLGGPDRRGPRLRGRASATSSRGELYQADEVFLTGHRRRDRAGARDRRPRARAARRAHAGDPDALLRRDQGQARRVPRVARLRRARERDRANYRRGAP